MRMRRTLLACVAALMLTGSAHIGATSAATSAEQRVRAEAEAMAEAASREFNAFMERQRVAQTDPAKPPTPAGMIGEMGLLGWFVQSSHQFQVLMRKLAGERPTVPPWDPVAEAAKRMPAGGERPKAARGLPASALSEPVPKPAAEPRRAAEAKPSAPETRAPDARAAKPGPRPELAKPAAPVKPVQAKAKAPEAPRVSAKEAGGPEAPTAAGEQEPAAARKHPEVKAPSPAATSIAPPAKSETAKAQTPAGKIQQAAGAAKLPDPARKATARGADVLHADKTALVSGPPPVKASKRSRKLKARSSRRPAAACAGAGRVRNGWYTVRQGDSLWRIAERHLGSGPGYRAVYAANRRRIADPDLIRTCQRIYIPQRSARRRH